LWLSIMHEIKRHVISTPIHDESKIRKFSFRQKFDCCESSGERLGYSSARI
jgi:hypothetical protein